MSANFKIMEDFNMNEIYEGIMNLYFILNRDGPTWVGGGRGEGERECPTPHNAWRKQDKFVKLGSFL